MKALKKDEIRNVLLNFKVTDSEARLIRNNASLFTHGNLSAWLRYASIELKPKSEDLIDVPGEFE